MADIDRIPSSEITPEHVFLNRRRFIQAGVAATSLVATGAAYRLLNRVSGGGAETGDLDNVVKADSDPNSGFRVDEPMTPMESVMHYNNFYEFTTDKEGVAAAAEHFAPGDWRISVGGMVHTPREFGIDDILKISPPEERVYRMRCVEAWSMVVPWAGFSFSRLLAKVDPMGSAKYVAFETLHDSERMPGQKRAVLDWPYVEGLRMDEAMHPLALLTSGLYGKQLPPQNGAPFRMIIPWKYGFKGIKSIVKITLVDTQPPTTWNIQAPGEYGFYANVNPQVDHPRWSQATEQRLGESGRRPTLMFNGYAEQVASLYSGMDLAVNF